MLLYQAAPESHRPVAAEDYQIRLWTDRYRGAELLFQPSIIGLECAGLSEALETICIQLTRQQKQAILQNLIIIGGNSRIKGFDERILSEIRMHNHQDTTINVVNQYAPDQRQISPWLGAAKFARTWNNQDISSFTISKQEYEECGQGYLKEHRLSNRV